MEKLRTCLYRPCIIPVGIPLSQLFGVFQGRSVKLSSSVVLHALDSRTKNAVSANSSVWRVKRFFIARNLIHDLVAFKNLVLLPFRHDVGDRAVRFDARDFHFGY
jgi:hypothetical protein